MLEPQGERCVSTLLTNDLFEEGPLYLERSGDRVRGILDRTVVVGTLDASGVLELRDAFTRSVVLRGRVDGAQRVTGTLLAEGETRAVSSVTDAPEPLPPGRFNLDVLRAGASAMGGATLERRGERVAGTVQGHGWWTRPPFDRAARGAIVAGALRLTVGDETWELRLGRRLLVGRAEPGGDVVLLLNPTPAPSAEPSAAAAPRPLALGEGRAVVPRVTRRATSTCTVSLVIPEVVGPGLAPATNQELAEEVVALALGPGGPDGALPSPAEVRCAAGEGTSQDPHVVDGRYEAVDLGNGWLSLRLEGYTRGGGARASVASSCLLVDLARQQIHRSAELLNDGQRQTLTRWVERRLRMSERTARLDGAESLYFADAAPVTARTALCLGRESLEVAFDAGEVTRYVPTRGPSVLVPRRLLARLVTSGSPLAQATGLP